MAFRPYSPAAASFRSPTSDVLDGFIQTSPVTTGQKILDAGTKVAGVLGLRGAVDVIGTNLANIGNVIDPTTSLDQKIAQSKELPQSTLKQNIGAGLSLSAATAGIAATPATIPSAIAVGAGVGAAQGAGSALQKNKSIAETAKQGAVGAAIGGTVAGAIGLAGKALKSTGEAAYKFLIPRSTREAGLLQAYKANVPFAERVKAALAGADTGAPITAADTAFDKGLLGTEGMLGIQAKRASKSIWDDVLAPQLDTSKTVVSMPAFFDTIEETIKKTNPELSRQKSLIEALVALREDYAGVATVPLRDLQSFKEGWAQFIPDKAYQGKPIAGAFRDVTNTAASLARSTIYKSLGTEARRAYFDYGNLQAIQELGKKAMSGGRFKGGFGGFWSAVKDIALTPIATVGGQVLYKTGEGLEFVGTKGAAVLADIITPKTLEFLLSSQEPTDTTNQ